jgi:hypothetical protein
MPLAGRAALLAMRARRALAFVAIVWAVGGSYVAFELASSGATDLMLSHPERFGALVLSRATTRSTTCVVAPGETASGAEGGVSAAEARAASWLLGIGLGRDAVIRQLSGADPRMLESGVGQMTRLSEALGVPAPVVFAPRQVVNAHREFAQFVEADDRQIAHRLAVGHAPQDCELYKLGAFWAYSAAVRFFLPDRRAIYDAEIRHHARKAALPESLWRPMVDPSASTDGADWAAQQEAVTARITKHLMSQPGPPESPASPPP